MTSDQSQTPFPELSRSSSRDPGPARGFPAIVGYQILKELPRGGQAMVYLALHLATKSKVALKVLHPDFHHSARAKRYFEQEVEFASRLHHPNIVAIRDSGVIQGLYYFAMAYIRGEPLNHYLKALDLSTQDKLVLFSKICDAMAHAHQHGVIHRDLKPSNILVDERGEPQVLDFGLAKSMDAMNRTDEGPDFATLTGEIRGTLAYMAPEQAEGHPNSIDVRTDVYALGVVLYRMLTGAFPYDVSGSALNTLT
jgi:eukaryotic-like serine/threonine-protein kinase